MSELVINVCSDQVLEVEHVKHANLEPVQSTQGKDIIRDLAWALPRGPENDALYQHMDRNLRTQLMRLLYRFNQDENIAPVIAEIQEAMVCAKTPPPCQNKELRWVPHDPDDRYWYAIGAKDVTEQHRAQLDEATAALDKEDDLTA